MPPAVSTAGAITPGGVRDGDPAVLAALCARRGPAVLAFTRALSQPHATPAAADAFARFRAAVVDSGGAPAVHPDALLLGCARRAALALVPPGPELGCPAARDLLCARAERSISPSDDGKLQRHLEICPSCRGISARLASADRAYREADDEPLPPDVTAAIVAALAAAAPVRPPDGLSNGAPKVTDLREPEPEPEPEPELQPEPEPEPALEPARFEHELELEPEEPELAAREPGPEPRLPYYRVPPPPSRARRRAERSKRAAQGAEAAVGAAASMARWAAGSARRALTRPAAKPPVPTPTATPAPPPPAAPPVEEPIAVTPPPDLPEPVEERPIVRTIGDFDDPEIVVADPTPAPRRRRERTPPPRLLRARPHHHRHYRPLRDHSPRELVIPASLLVAAAAIIMAVAGVFGNGRSTPAPATARIVSTSAPKLTHPERSATSISLATAEVLAASTPTPPTTP